MRATAWSPPAPGGNRVFRTWSRCLAVFGLTVALTMSLLPSPASAQRQLKLLRDAETEAMLRDFGNPILKAAGLDPQAVTFYIVDDNSLNAFVAGGQNIFFNTGLIASVSTPGELKGVLAHETGHIAGGHLARSRDAMSQATVPMVISTLLGIGAIAAGAGDAGMALILGGQHVAQRSLMAYTRTQESQADQAGATFLEGANESGAGMLTLFNKFRDQEVLTASQQDPYARSHPVSRERLSALQQRVQNSPYYEKEDPPEDVERLRMVQAKLYGFLDNPAVTFRRFPASDNSDEAHYARSIAYHKQGQLALAVAELQPLKKSLPDDPYVAELEGQILFESGKPKESVSAYEEAVKLKPSEAQFQLGLGRALLALDTKDADKEALKHLQTAAQLDRQSSLTYFHLAIAYARAGNEAMADLSTAERFYTSGQMQEAQHYARRAQRKLDPGSPSWMRAEDIISEG